MSELYIGRRFAAVAKSDSTNLTSAGVAPKGFYVGGAGNLALKYTPSSTAVTFENVPAGSFLPVSAELVMSTNTTATAIVAIY